MFKSILLFLLILAVAIAVGFGIFHLIQPSGGIAFRSSGIGFTFRDFGGDRGFDGGFSLIGGLFGITGNLILVAIVTFIVVSVRNIFARQPEPVTTR
jgi:hypothetical protein